jgi:hypothetical protein
MDYDSHDAAMVVFAYSAGVNGIDYEKVSFVVPANLLWTSEGLKYLFEATRMAYLVPPGSPYWNSQDQEAWESWHVVSMQEETEYQIISNLAPDPADVT